MTAKRQAEPLTREAAARSMRRILCQFPVGTDTKTYFESIFEQAKLEGLTSDLFDAACIRLAGMMQPYKPPVAAEYKDAARQIKATRIQTRTNCPDCQGRGWIYVRDLRDAAAPLLAQPINQSEIKPGDKVAVATCQACKPVGA
jgi:hypothetical protein